MADIHKVIYVPSAAPPPPPPPPERRGGTRSWQAVESTGLRAGGGRTQPLDVPGRRPIPVSPASELRGPPDKLPAASDPHSRRVVAPREDTTGAARPGRFLGPPR